MNESQSSKDIVERLRSAELQWPVRHDAAEEIERLCAEIDHINRYWQQFDHYPKGSPDETPAEPITSAWVDFTIKRVHELVNGEYAKGWRDCVAAYNKAGELIFSGEKIPPEWESELWPQVPLPPTANECWEAVNALIDTGHLSGNGTDLTAQRNGIILAANAIAALMRNRGALKTTGVTIDSSRPKCPSCGMYAPDPGFPCGCCGRVAPEKAGAPKDNICSRCLGSGTIEVPDEAGPNAYPMNVNCPCCGGTGAVRTFYGGNKAKDEPCAHCGRVWDMHLGNLMCLTENGS